MALITCPKCGKQISDTAKACVHCGFSLLGQEKKETAVRELIDYNKLSFGDKNVLRTEFLKKNPAYEECEKRRERFLKFINFTCVAYVVFVFLFAGFWIGGMIYHQASKEDAPVFVIVIMLVSLALTLIFLIANILQRKVFYKKHRHNELIIMKKMQKWLKEEKGVSYKVFFGAKQAKDKVFFDNVDAANDNIKR